MALNLSDLRVVSDQQQAEAVDNEDEGVPGALMGCMRVASAILGRQEAASASSTTSGAAAGVLYCTGHQDGHVRLWDVFGEQPRLLLTAPSGLSSRGHPGGGPWLKSVTVLELLWEHGVLVTGHAKGEVSVCAHIVVQSENEAAFMAAHSACFTLPVLLPGS